MKINYPGPEYQRDLKAQLTGRLERDRSTIVPWLDQTCSLNGLRILEIGCGTGSSTVALAEQGATVVGIDIDESALKVARDRCDVYGVEADFHFGNAESVSTLSDDQFDCVIFFACLEHMTVSERLTSLRKVWQLLPTEGLLVVVETPNRLWFFDQHTSLLPFFNWLPDELAFRYSTLSERSNFRELYRDYTDETRMHFLRRGRGVSFHEFDLAIGPTTDLDVASSLVSFRGLPGRWRLTRLERRYKAVLKRIYPSLHDGLFDPWLDIIIRKH